MLSPDKACTIVPYFKVAPDKLEAFKTFATRCVEQTRAEENCLFYGFSYSGDEAHCREGYVDAAAALEHLEKIGPLLNQVLEISHPPGNPRPGRRTGQNA